MKRTVIHTRLFSRVLDELISKRRILRRDFDRFETTLVENPRSGVPIPGLAGLRKIRMKGAYSGKSGSFRVDYLDIPQAEVLYLIVVYPKNVQEDLSSEEKQDIKRVVEKIKKEHRKHG